MLQTHSAAEVVKGVVARVLKVDRDTLRPDTNLITDLQVDSLDALEIAVQLQDALRIELGEDDFSEFSTVGQIMTCVQDAVDRQRAAPSNWTEP